MTLLCPREAVTGVEFPPDAEWPGVYPYCRTCADVLLDPFFGGGSIRYTERPLSDARRTTRQRP